MWKWQKMGWRPIEKIEKDVFDFSFDRPEDA